MKLSVLLAIACLLAAAFVVAGCLKGDKHAADPAAAQKNVETAEASASAELRPTADRVDAPPIKATTIDGKEMVLDARKDGKVLIVNFWATWCPPCRAEMPELDSFARDLKSRGDVAFYAVNLGDSGDAVHRFLVEEGINEMTVLLDENDSAGRQYAVQSIPTTVIIDLNGKIAYRKIGMTNAAELKAAFAALEAEKK